VSSIPRRSKKSQSPTGKEHALSPHLEKQLGSKHQFAAQRVAKRTFVLINPENFYSYCSSPFEEKKTLLKATLVSR
jgi:hypothetical protein